MEIVGKCLFPLRDVYGPRIRRREAADGWIEKFDHLKSEQLNSAAAAVHLKAIQSNSGKGRYRYGGSGHV